MCSFSPPKWLFSQEAIEIKQLNLPECYTMVLHMRHGRLVCIPRLDAKKKWCLRHPNADTSGYCITDREWSIDLEGTRIEPGCTTEQMARCANQYEARPTGDGKERVQSVAQRTQTGWCQSPLFCPSQRTWSGIWNHPRSLWSWATCRDWSSKDTADHYASSLALKAAANEVAKVGYEGLDLTHLYPR